MNAQKIKQQFNKAANDYDQHCQLQIAIGEKLIQISKEYLNNAASILDLGCGTGIVTQKLAKQFSFQQFHAMDIANALLSKARERLSGLNIHITEINFNQGLQLTQSFDLIFSNMALQWSEHLSLLLQAIQTHMTSNGLLAFSIPLAGTYCELSADYSHNIFYDNATLNTLFMQQRLHTIYQQNDTHIIPFNDTRTALQSIKQIGASYVKERRHRGLLGTNFLTRFTIKQLTYHIGYFLLKKR